MAEGATRMVIEYPGGDAVEWRRQPDNTWHAIPLRSDGVEIAGPAISGYDRFEMDRVIGNALKDTVMDYFEHWLPLIERESTTLRADHTDHGQAHWRRVLNNAREIARGMDDDELDMVVIELFCVFHDAMRESEHSDPEHGLRAYLLAGRIGALASITQEQRDVLLDAMRDHDAGFVSRNLNIGVCWDADRLDLPRVGITPDPDLFSTDEGKRIVGERYG